MAIKVLTNRERARFFAARLLTSAPLQKMVAAPLTAAIAAVVGFCIRRPWQVLAVALALAVGAAAFSARHFAIRTDSDALISPDLPWAQRALTYMHAFPRVGIIVVIDAPSGEAAAAAQAELAGALADHREGFTAVSTPGGGAFYERNGLLFLDKEEVGRITAGARRADALLGTLTADPSLRGVLSSLSMVFVGVKRGLVDFDAVATPLRTAADTAERAAAGEPASFSWQALAAGAAPSPALGRRFVLLDPVLDFDALRPGEAATALVERTAADLGFAARGIRVRQTGRVPIDDDQFGTLRESAVVNFAASILGVLAILWLALRSAKIITAVAVSLMVGLALSTAAGLLLTGALNLISVAFFVLFIGLGVDFGLQFSVRYRAERHAHGDLGTALAAAARKAGLPLALAALATAVGFCSFLPTDYRGLAELGEIAGAGMLIAFATSVTVLPAVLALIKPPSEASPVGWAALAPVDRFLERHRVAVVAGTVAAVVLASPLLLMLRFDFDPMHLHAADDQSVATYYELRHDPMAGAGAIEIVARNADDARAIAARLAALPEVGGVRTLDSFVPADQDVKLPVIRSAAAALRDDLEPADTLPAPGDADTVTALTQAATTLFAAADGHTGPGPEAARHLAGVLTRLAAASAAERGRVERAFVEPLQFALAALRRSLDPEPVAREAIPGDLVRDWVAADGRARVQVLPAGDPDDSDTMRAFVSAVLRAEPDATGPAVELFEAGRTVVHAFVVAGAFALAAITVLLLIALGRAGDVLLTLVPLVVAGVVTLEVCAAFGLPLNFANIMALPLLLGVGVAFKIYYILAWRDGRTQLLQSSLTRAVACSALTTATAFGSLWLSSDPGTSSMGRLMALALVCTMAAAILFQPALMGPPRKA